MSEKRHRKDPGEDASAEMGFVMPARLSTIDWAAMVLFWILGAIVLLQFGSRYLLNDSIAWTEEIARYLLIGVVFVGSAIAVRRRSHIKVEFFHHYLTSWTSKRLDLLVMLIGILFFAAAAYLCFKLSGQTRARMVSIDIPKKVIYYTVAAAFGAMLYYAGYLLWNTRSKDGVDAPAARTPKLTTMGRISKVFLAALVGAALIFVFFKYYVALLLALLFILLIIGVPVALSLAVSSLVFILFEGRIPEIVLIHRMINGVDSFPLIAIPFFIMAGSMMNAVGITDRIFDFAKALVGWLPGGLGHVNISASVIFAGMSGAAVADAGGLGIIEIKAMKDAGYDTDFSVGVTAASSTIGPIIPPSLPMVVFGVLASTSIGKLFAAGLIPGLVMALALMGMVAWFSLKRGYSKDTSFSLANMGRTSLRAVLSLMTPVIIVGGILGGIFTPTEAAIAAVAYATCLGIYYRSLTWKKVIAVTFETMETTAVILFIVAGASIFAWILTSYRVADNFAASLLAVTTNKYMVLLVITGIVLMVGCFMETIASITILVPVLLPVVTKIGIDPTHFGVFMILNLMIGLLTPPVGMVLYVLSRVSGISFEQAMKATAPFLVVLVAVLLLLTFVPGFSLWLPGVLYGN